MTQLDRLRHLQRINDLKRRPDHAISVLTGAVINLLELQEACQHRKSGTLTPLGVRCDDCRQLVDPNEAPA